VRRLQPVHPRARPLPTSRPRPRSSAQWSRRRRSHTTSHESQPPWRDKREARSRDGTAVRSADGHARVVASQGEDPCSKYGPAQSSSSPLLCRPSHPVAALVATFRIHTVQAATHAKRRTACERLALCLHRSSAPRWVVERRREACSNIAKLKGVHTLS
jgi:hypothetical protein